jgi:hypothetical protein
VPAGSKLLIMQAERREVPLVIMCMSLGREELACNRLSITYIWEFEVWLGPSATMGPMTPGWGEPGWGSRKFSGRKKVAGRRSLGPIGRRASWRRAMADHPGSERVRRGHSGSTD